MIVFRPNARFAVAHPAHFIAFGFGVGLLPVAPGTAGTLLAWAIERLAGGALPPGALAAIAAAGFPLGVWACGLTGRRLGIPDHGAMVWDEIVAFLLVLAVIPAQFGWQAAAFVLFRLCDIVKPPPIRWFERRYRGGFGVMFDDLLAAGYTLVALAFARRVFF
jgi:phosphatidylglycerophosphatase A